MLDPKKPGQFWKAVNREIKSKCKSVVQPILRDDNMSAVTDKEIFQDMKKRYGRETLDVKEDHPDWFDSVEEEGDAKTHSELNNIRQVIFRSV